MLKKRTRQARYKRTMGFRLSPGLEKRIVETCLVLDITIGEFMRNLITAYFRNNNK